MASRVRVTRLPADEKSLHGITARVALELGVPLAAAKALLEHVPVTLPLRSQPEDAEILQSELNAAGGDAEVVAVPEGAPMSCVAHSRLEPTFPCEDCSTLLCEVCRGLASGKSQCEACRRKASRTRRFYRIRVAVLLAVLASVCLYAWSDIRSRGARTTWKRSLHIAVVLLQNERVSPGAREHFQNRKSEVEQQLAKEFSRHRTNAPQPFVITVVGPVQVTAPPPEPRSGELLALGQHAIDQWSYLRDVHQRANAFDPDNFDSRIYVFLKPGNGSKTFIEGRSQQGGRLGVVQVDLREDMIDFAWFVVAHELFHTLGATDKYDASGRALIPQGLANPEQEPLFPQSHVEIMAHNRPLGAGGEVPPTSIEQLRVNRHTALEIGWLLKPGSDPR